MVTKPFRCDIQGHRMATVEWYSSEPSSFQSTSWTLIERLKDPAHRNSALEMIVTRYRKPLLIFAKRRGWKDSEDLVQSFLAFALDKSILERPMRDRSGKFRNWLLTTFSRFVRDLRTKSQEKFENGLRPMTSKSDDEKEFLIEPIENDTAVIDFERQWAFNLVLQAYALVKEKAEAPWHYDLFIAKTEAMNRGEDPSWKELASRIGRQDKSKDQLYYAWEKVLAIARENLTRLISEESGATSPKDLEVEVSRLFELLAMGEPCD